MKKLTMLLSLLCLTAALAVPASALEYDIASPGDPEYGKPTSVEPVATADRGELSNVDVSKNAALVPPAFGSPTAYTLNTGTPLTPNLAICWAMVPLSMAAPAPPSLRLIIPASPAAAHPASSPPSASRRSHQTSTIRAATSPP